MPTRRDLANAIRALSMDAVQKANSGHRAPPWAWPTSHKSYGNDYLKHNPRNPGWADRDRFVLSNGHGSMLLYSLLHLSGYDLPIEELQRFRSFIQKHPGTRNTVTLLAWRPLPGRLVRVLPMPWGWPSPRRRWLPVQS